MRINVFDYKLFDSMYSPKSMKSEAALFVLALPAGMVVVVGGPVSKQKQQL